jgi:hypothetical protein
VKLEEQLRNDAQSLAELGWFNRADMMKSAADEIKRLEQRIKRLEEAGDKMAFNHNAFTFIAWREAKEAKP